MALFEEGQITAFGLALENLPLLPAGGGGRRLSPTTPTPGHVTWEKGQKVLSQTLVHFQK